MIEFSDTGKRFGIRGAGVEALAAVTIRVEAGECVAVVGPNGAGKSTLLGLVLGFMRPTSGSLSVGGMTARDWVRHHGAAYLPERFTLPDGWSVRGGLRALARLEGAGDDVVSRVDVAIERFGLAEHASKRIGALSRGLLQRVGLAQSTLTPRNLVVLDEPTEGLDQEGRLLFRETVTTMRDAGATVLIASHDLAELERLTQRAIVLEAGRVRESVDIQPPDIAESYTIRVIAPDAAVTGAFPGAGRLDARPAGTDGMAAGAETAGGEKAVSGTRWTVRPASAVELNTRLSALIATGALVLEVKPAAPSLEDAIRRAGKGGKQ